jgi:hypothetical protein
LFRWASPHRYRIRSLPNLALDIRGADPSWAAKAVTLAALVLDSAQAISEQDDGKQGGGQR